MRNQPVFGGVAGGDPFERHPIPPPLPPPPAPPRSMPRHIGRRAWDQCVHHALGIAAGSLLGLAVSVAGMLAIVGAQVAYDDSSGTSGSQPPQALAWLLVAIAGLALIAAVAATVGSIVGLVRRRRERPRRTVGYHVGALILAAPGMAIVTIAVIALVVVGIGP